MSFNQKLEYVKLYRISLCDVVALAEKMPSAFKIFAFFVENCQPNINLIRFRNIDLSACLGISKDQVSRALKYLVEYKFIKRNGFPDVSWSINMYFMSKGAEDYKKGYYEPCQYAKEEIKDAFYLKNNWIVENAQTLNRDGTFITSQALIMKEK